MNVDILINKYFSGDFSNPNIEMFDSENIHSVYTRLIGILTNNSEIELSVLQALGYCFYEILDNVITHSNKVCGTVITRFIQASNLIQILVADEGIGVHKSLTENKQYANYSEAETIEACIKDKVSDGKGMGFGLYSTARLITDAGIILDIHSGSHTLHYNGKDTEIVESDYWQGTIVYLELHSNRPINPIDVVENRTDCVSEFNETFFKNSEIDDLW